MSPLFELKVELRTFNSLSLNDGSMKPSLAYVLFEPCVNLIFNLFTVLLFTILTHLFQVSTTRCVKKYFRTF